MKVKSLPRQKRNDALNCAHALLDAVKSVLRGYLDAGLTGSMEHGTIHFEKRNNGAFLWGDVWYTMPHAGGLSSEGDMIPAGHARIRKDFQEKVIVKVKRLK